MAKSLVDQSIDLQEQKNILRQHYRSQRDAMSSSECSELSDKISDHLIQLIKENPSWKNLASYSAMDGEANLSKLCDVALSENRNLLFPKVRGERDMGFFPVKDLENDFYVGTYGISEPKSETEFPAENIDCVFIPALSYDQSGYRLGQGKAYYDCFLQKTEARRIGVAFENQIHSESLPKEDHDQPVDFLVTEKDMIKLKRES